MSVRRGPVDRDATTSDCAARKTTGGRRGTCRARGGEKRERTAQGADAAGRRVRLSPGSLRFSPPPPPPLPSPPSWPQ